MHSLDVHSAAVLHDVPGSFFVTHTPPEQYWLLLQFASPVHDPGPVQRVPTHVSADGQSCCASGGQLPAPSQNAPSVARLAWQSAARQDTPGPG